MDTIPAIFRDFSILTLTRYETQIVGCLERLTDDQIWERGHEHLNTIGNLILHLNGNLGQYIVSGAGGATDVRERDAEFNTSGGLSRSDLQARFTGRVAECTEVIRNVPDPHLTDQVLVQGRVLPVLSIIYKAVEHFALHAGQIMMLTKQLTGQELGYTTHARSGK